MEVGASGDAASVNSVGFRVEIRTHIYQVNSPDVDYFMVGAYLTDAGYIEFGYRLLPAGIYCSKAEVGPDLPDQCSDGSQTVNGSQPVWYWEYSPNVTGRPFYYGSGYLDTLQTNATWHLYSILPDVNGRWAFEIDGTEVASAQFPLSSSRDRMFVFAAKTTNATALGRLGPVEFQNLAYLRQDGWHSVEILYSIVSCGLNTQCPSNPYGVSLIGPNHIIAGTSVPQPSDGNLLWIVPSPSTVLLFSVTTISSVLETLRSYALQAVVILIVSTVTIVVVRRKRSRVGNV